MPEHHGLTKNNKQPPEYQIWSQIKMRCFNPNHPKYPSYGGRGITMHLPWRDSYLTFLKEVGKRPSKNHQIERKNNDRGYVPGNVTWAPRKVQMRNTRINKWLLYKGRWWVLVELAEHVKMDRKRLQDRLARGWSVKEAVERPVERGNLYIDYEGETHSLSVWAKKVGIAYETLHTRIYRKHWGIKDAFTIPPKRGQRINR